MPDPREDAALGKMVIDPKSRPVICAVLDLHEERGRDAYFSPAEIEEAIPLDEGSVAGSISNLDAIGVLFPLSRLPGRLIETWQPDEDSELRYRIRPDLQRALRASYGR